MKVCVTGASGFVASELVHQLLSKGYEVVGTVRDTTHPEKLPHLLEMQEQFPGKLTLVEADLLVPGSFQSAITGVNYVFHTASPFFSTADDPQRQLIEPALEGTRNVLNTVADIGTVQRVVLTSSVAAIRGPGQSPVNGEFFTEEDWNLSSTVETSPYPLSKTLAEREAWKIAAERGIDLVAINPSFIVGPPRGSRPDGTSLSFMKTWIETGMSSTNIIMVDVRDIAAAHILAAETPTASGRYIVSSEHNITPGYTAKALIRGLPSLHIHVAPDEDGVTYPKIVDNSKVTRDLGLVLRPLDEALIDMAKELIARGLATPGHEHVHT